MVLWNASLHELPKMTETVTGWESSIVVLTKIIGQPIFWPKNLMLTLKFTNFDLFWHINFLHLKLQNNSAFGVEVNSEANLFHTLQIF